MEHWQGSCKRKRTGESRRDTILTTLMPYNVKRYIDTQEGCMRLLPVIVLSVQVGYMHCQAH